MNTWDDVALQYELTRDEGFALRAYKDTAQPPRWSIGIGRNLIDVGISPAETEEFGCTTESCIARGITQTIAVGLYQNDVARTVAALDRRLPWWRQLDPVRQRVLINMTFNLGIMSLLQFTNMLAAVRRGAWAVAAQQMRASKWAKQVGERATRLEQMMETGEAV